DALVELVLVDPASRCGKVIGAQTGRRCVGFRVKLKQTDGGRVNAVPGNGIAGERLRDAIHTSAGSRIIDGLAPGKIATSHRRCRQGEGILDVSAVPITFEIRHEKQPVSSVVEFRNSYGTGECEPVLVPVKKIFRLETCECK